MCGRYRNPATAMFGKCCSNNDSSEKGLSMTGDRGVEPAMEWILNHADEFEAGPSNVATNSNQNNAAGTSKDALNSEEVSSVNSAVEEAKSLLCDECGKLFTSQLLAEFHASKTGHSQFSESTEEKKPLTEEEKQEQMRKIEEVLKQKRLDREEKEKLEALQREKDRLRSGKDLTEVKRRLEEMEMKKLIEERKRDKEEEKQARLRIKKLIEQDKLARKKNMESASTVDNDDLNKNDAQQTTVQQNPPPLSQIAQPPRDYSETKLQLRLPNGEILTQTFNVKEQLSAVRLYVELNRTDGDTPFKLMTNFPRKIFSDKDYEMRLVDLGLVPSAVIIVTKVSE